jgi:hypothetical protein
MPSFPDPARAKSLTDARQQAHHAAQFATAAGISFLPKKADDSHTNLEWLSALGALASRVVPSSASFRVAIRIAGLEICVLNDASAVVASLPLNGRTIGHAELWLRECIAQRGADAAKLTLDKHYEIPHHAVDDGRAFDASDRQAFVELAGWFDVAARTLARARTKNDGSEVRCWPHHFDIATLIEVGPGKSVGVGMEPGDNYYDEPYFYVNAYPSPLAEAVTAPLAGGGSWHTHEWVGAVLPGSRVRTASSGESQIAEFQDSAIAACRQLVAARV